MKYRFHAMDLIKVQALYMDVGSHQQHIPNEREAYSREKTLDKLGRECRKLHPKHLSRES